MKFTLPSKCMYFIWKLTVNCRKANLTQAKTKAFKPKGSVHKESNHR